MSWLWGLTSCSDSLPICTIPSQLAGTPNNASHPSWWCPTSNPHCPFYEIPVWSVFSNISSSNLAKHSLSKSTSHKIDRTLVICTSQAFSRISILLFILYVGFWSFGMWWRGYRHKQLVRNPTKLSKVFVFANVSFKSISNLGSLHNNREGPNIWNDCFFEVLTLIFEPLLGGYELAGGFRVGTVHCSVLSVVCVKLPCAVDTTN